MKCVALPVGREVEVTPDGSTATAVASAVEWSLNLPNNSVVVMQKSVSGSLAFVDEVNSESTVYALVRCRAGGKGGFRKQLEKKGREFARAQRAEERAKRQSSTQAKKAAKETKEKEQATQIADTQHSKDFVAEMTTNSQACRQLAKQGVALTIAKALQKATPTL